jgi:phage tail tube protein FII
MAAAGTVYVMEGANLICGDTVSGSEGTSPGVSTHLVLQELKLPTLEENYVEHTPAGAPIGIEVPTHINRMEATFNLAGWDPKIMRFMGQNESRYHTFTAYGMIRNRRNSVALQAIAVMQGRLGRVNPTAFSRGNLMAHEYSIKSIVSYTLHMQEEIGEDPLPIYEWDFFTSDFVVGGNDINAELQQTLAIP